MRRWAGRWRRHIGQWFRHSEPRFEPRFDDQAFFGGLRSEAQALRQALDHHRAGAAPAAWHEVLAHYRSRVQPRFFVETERIVPALSSARAAPWLAAQRLRVQQDLEVGLRVFSLRAEALARGLNWGADLRGPGRDILYGTQRHRFGFMPRLAMMGLAGMPTLPVLRQVLDDWIACALAGEPECYHSPLAVLNRLVALSWTMGFVVAHSDRGGADAVLERLLRILAADLAYLRPTIGASYPNNHLLADGFAAWYAGTLFPEFADAQAMREAGAALFERELLRQFLPDGCGFEHSMHYHETGCEMAAAYLLLGRRNGLRPSPPVERRIERMLAFQASIAGKRSYRFAFGNAIEDPMFPLDSEHGFAPGAMRELYRGLFDPAVTPAHAQDLTVERAFWMLGTTLAEPGPPAADLPVAFEQGGFFVFDDEALDSRLVMRSGAAEGQPLAAGHAHADALSLVLWVKERPVLVDPGTYTYRFKADQWPPGAPRWRAYFAGPWAHNIVHSGSDPCGELSGDFRGLDVPCRVRATFDGEADGIAWHEFMLTGPVPLAGWCRGVVQVLGHGWLVYDIVPAAPQAEVRAGLQFAANCSVECLPSRLAIETGAGPCSILLAGATAEQSVLQGSIDPLAGWVSPSYGELAPAPQWRARGLGPLHAMFIGPGPALPDAAVIEGDADRLIWRCTTPAGDHRIEISRRGDIGLIWRFAGADGARSTCLTQARQSAAV